MSCLLFGLAILLFLYFMACNTYTYWQICILLQRLMILLIVIQGRWNLFQFGGDKVSLRFYTFFKIMVFSVESYFDLLFAQIWWGQIFTLILVYSFSKSLYVLLNLILFHFLSKFWWGHIPCALLGTCPHCPPSDNLFRRPC